MLDEHAQEDGSVHEAEDGLLHAEASELGRDPGARFGAFLFAERWTWASFIVHGAALLAMTLLPPRSSALALDMLSDDARYARYLATPIERVPVDAFDLADGDAAPSSAKAADSAGKAGKPDAPARARRMSGGSANPTAIDPRVAARQAGILGVLARQKLVPSGPGDFDLAGAGGGLESEYGGFLGVIGPSFGFNGLEMHGTGRGGGGEAEGSVGVGKLGTVGGGLGGNGCPGCAPAFRGPHHDARVPSLRSGEPDVAGSLSKEVIRRVIQRHLNEVRFCYEENLKRAPELAGRVEVKFIIAPSGAVQMASYTANTLAGDGARTAECIRAAVQRWSFPAPDGGGVVVVSYPFRLEATP